MKIDSKNDNIFIRNRIMIIGCGGSGKTTMARELAKIFALPIIHLDKEYWQPDWVPTPKDEWRDRQKELVAGERWIIDGNYNTTMNLRLERADTVIFLDFNRFTCLCGALKRWLTHIGKTRDDMGFGCNEKIDFEFLKWIWSFNKDSRPKIIKLLSNSKDIDVLILKNRREVKRFLKGTCR